MTGTWDTARGSELVRRAYRYVAETMPPEADLDVLGEYEDAAIAAQLASDFEAIPGSAARYVSLGEARGAEEGASGVSPDARNFHLPKASPTWMNSQRAMKTAANVLFVVRERNTDERDGSTDRDCTGL